MESLKTANFQDANGSGTVAGKENTVEALNGTTLYKVGHLVPQSASWVPQTLRHLAEHNGRELEDGCR